ncbi:Met-10 like-protein, partial [Brugia malayi]
PFAMLKSVVTARLFHHCFNNSPNRSISSSPRLLSLLVLSPIWLELLSLLLLASATSQFSSGPLQQSQPRGLDTEQCQTNSPGDCNPYSCRGTCEGRYVRFWDSRLKIDRTVKSCQCMQEPICSLIGMNAYTGCRTYTMLSTSAQRFIRLWTMNDAKKFDNQRSALLVLRFDRSWDRLRHDQLLNGNSKFCCRTANITFSNSIISRYTSLSILLPISFVLLFIN